MQYMKVSGTQLCEACEHGASGTVDIGPNRSDEQEGDPNLS